MIVQLAVLLLGNSNGEIGIFCLDFRLPEYILSNSTNICYSGSKRLMF